ncbi:hypothetical protein SLEP1_g1107 [Rubroshorea leprosula]|uniref:Uncharacterized protein n=1 Tax=Rubroshorea leprosula TaxID=152421 RepID=A0AAV5HIL5_9ROSI|nr:hypothetical protein SLEP1_g1107 [Rubroshorea leprosula]
MMGSKSESVVLPLVARKVKNASAAMNASNSEGLSEFLKSGASGLVVSLEDLKLFSDPLSQLLYNVSVTNEKPEDELQSFNMSKMLGTNHDSYQSKGGRLC